MRTNAIDALAWRSLVEYKNLLDVLIKLDGDDFDGHDQDLTDHTARLYNLPDAKSIREYQRPKINDIKERINVRIEEIKKNNISVVELE